MSASLVFLGTGASSGSPMIGCQCPVCISSSDYNKRLRPSVLLQIEGKNILIDSGPDFRQQALRHNITQLDGVLITHTHFDHVGGLDELRSYYLIHRHTIPVLVSLQTLASLKKRYDYLFLEKQWGVSLAAQLHFQVLENHLGETSFLDLPIKYVTYSQGGMDVNGFVFGNLAYLTDVKIYEDHIFEILKGTDILILNALRSSESPMHLTFDEAIKFAEKIGAKQLYLTHIAHDVDHESTQKQLPSNCFLAYDGLTLSFQL